MELIGIMSKFTLHNNTLKDIVLGQYLFLFLKDIIDGLNDWFALEI